jgi:hypothetical protein
MPEKYFIPLASAANVIKLFLHNSCQYEHVALSFDSGYADISVNYARKILYNLGLCGQCYKTFFLHNSCQYEHVALSFDSGYADSNVNYARKILYNIGLCGQCYKTFFLHNLCHY